MAYFASNPATSKMATMITSKAIGTGSRTARIASNAIPRRTMVEPWKLLSRKRTAFSRGKKVIKIAPISPAISIMGIVVMHRNHRLRRKDFTNQMAAGRLRFSASDTAATPRPLNCHQLLILLQIVALVWVRITTFSCKSGDRRSAKRPSSGTIKRINSTIIATLATAI